MTKTGYCASVTTKKVILSHLTESQMTPKITILRQPARGIQFWSFWPFLSLAIFAPSPQGAKSRAIYQNRPILGDLAPYPTRWRLLGLWDQKSAFSRFDPDKTPTRWGRVKNHQISDFGHHRQNRQDPDDFCEPKTVRADQFWPIPPGLGLFDPEGQNDPENDPIWSFRPNDHYPLLFGGK